MLLAEAPRVCGVDVTPPAAFLTKYKKRAGKLLMLSDAANKALKVSRDPSCTIESFTTVVGHDVKLATDILKIANSVLYSPRSPILNLHRAVVRLGFVECQNLILTSSLASIVNKVSMEQEWIRTVLWWHSLNTGLLATYINRSFHAGFQGEEFTAGIIHDVGRMLIAIVYPERYNDIDPLEFHEGPEVLDHEMSVIGTDHCKLGAWFALQNKIPSPIPELILRHHLPEKARDAEKLTSLIAVADHMANYVQRTGQAEGYEPQSNPYLPNLKKFMRDTFEPHFLEIAVSLMEEAQRDARSMLDL
jgi:HD-like signal output (HDOD) protein